MLVLKLFLKIVALQDINQLMQSKLWKEIPYQMMKLKKSTQ